MLNLLIKINILQFSQVVEMFCILNENENENFHIKNFMSLAFSKIISINQALTNLY